MSTEPRTRRDLLQSIGATATGAAVLGSFAGCAASGHSTTVTMQEMAFQPPRLEVAPGTTVEWVNDSDVPHTVTAYEDVIPDDASYFASGDFGSERAARNDISAGLLDPGDTYTHRFAEPGIHAYYCIPHEGGGMTADIIVK